MASKQELLNTIIKASKNTKHLDALLKDLLTPKEYKDIITRVQIIKLLKAGLPQRQIAKMLKVGIATVTRGSRVLSNL